MDKNACTCHTYFIKYDPLAKPLYFLPIKKALLLPLTVKLMKHNIVYNLMGTHAQGNVT